MSNRFRLDTGCIIDQQENKVLSDVQVRNLLNKLNDENEQLKQQRIDLLRLIDNNIEIYENINTNVEFHKGEIQGKLTLLYNLRELILMTAKRFTIKPQDDYFGIVDNYSADKVCVINGIRTEIEAEWLCKDMNTLNDENEQLKSRVEYLERKIQRERASAMKQHEKWEKELKATIKEAYNNERTMIGKSVLKQLMEQIQ